VTVQTYVLPSSVPEALGLLAAHGPELLVMAGGTVAMPLVNEGISLPTHVMGLRRAGLDGVHRTGGELRVGATATLTTLAGRADVPLLAEAARRTGSWAVRNLATVGGNLFTPPPGGDVATALLALDARVEVAGPAGVRVVPLANFWTGFMTTVVAGDELVTAILVPDRPGAHAFVKFGRRHANTPAVVTVAVHARIDDGTVRAARVALGAVGPHPVRAAGAEAALEGRRLDESAIADAAEAAVDEVEPDTDAVASGGYRRRMAGVWVRRALAELAEVAAPARGREA
jgi:CO/xanthine dehydrogenase FAD-binding subunit